MSYYDKLANLAYGKEQKLQRLSEKTFADENLTHKSYTDMGDGYIENNGNKIWNISGNWSPEQMSFLRDVVNNDYALPNSSRQDRRSYEYGVTDEGKFGDVAPEDQDPTYDPSKIGLSTGKADTSDVRYQPENGGFAPGPYGVDLNKKRQDANVAHGAATAFEALTHSNNTSFDNRIVRERADGFYDYDSPTGIKVLTKDEKDALFGSGSSEYYRNTKNMFADDYSNLSEEAKQEVLDGLQQAMKIVAGDKYEVPTPTDWSPDQYQVGDNISPITRVGNSLAGFGATLVNELLVNPLDWVGDTTGLYDFGNEESKSKNTNDFFGYDPIYAQASMERIGKQWEVLSDSDASLHDRVKAAGNGILEGFTTPELFTTSLGALSAWAAPGSVLFKLGAGSKFINASRAIDAEVAAGNLTKTEARLAKAKELMSVEGAKAALVQQSGYLVSAMGNVHNQYEQFVANNNGVELEGSEKNKFYMQRLGIQILNQNLDALTDFRVIKSPGMIKAIVPAVKAMSNKEFANVAKTMSKGIAKTSENMGLEFGQEYAQTMMELYNARYGSEQFKDVDTFTSFINDERNTTEAGIAGLAGAGGAGQFELAGTVLSSIGGVGSNLLNRKDSSVKTVDSSVTAGNVEAPAAEDEVILAKQRYGEVLKRVAKGVAEDNLNADTIGSYLDDLDTLNSTKHVISTSSPENIAAGESTYNAAVDGIEKFIRKNPDVILTKRKVLRKTVEEAVKEQENIRGSSPSSESFDYEDYTDVTRATDAERIVSTLLGSNKTYDNAFINTLDKFALNNGVSQNRINSIKRSYAAVDEEAVSGNRGYNSRITRLKGLVDSSNPDVDAIKREYVGLVKMQQSLASSVENIERSLVNIQNKIADLNKSPTIGKNTIKYETGYMKLNQKTGKYDDPFIVYLRKGKGGKWFADEQGIKEVKKRLAAKKEYIEDIVSELRPITRRANQANPDLFADFSSYTVPDVPGNKKTINDREKRYLKGVESALKVIRTDTAINKVILGDNISDKWKASGRHFKANNTLVNSGNYIAEDVVLVNSLGTRKVGKDTYFPDLVPPKDTPIEEYTTAQKNFKEAIDAGATIVIDNSMHGTVGKTSLIEYLINNKKYTSLQGYNGNVFAKTTENQKAAIEAHQKKIAAEKAAKELKQKRLDDLVGKSFALKFEIDPETGEKLSPKTKAKIKKEINKLSIDLAPDFDKDKTKLLNYVNRRLEADVKEAATEILEDNAAAPINFKNKAFEYAVKEYVDREVNKETLGAEVLKDWKDLVEVEETTGKEREVGIKALLEKLGVSPKGLIDSILGERSIAKGKDPVYELHYMKASTKELVIVMSRSKLTDAQLKEKFAANEKDSTSKINHIGEDKTKHIFLDMKKVEQDATKLVNVTKTTVFNSMSVDMLPIAIRNRVASLEEVFFKAIEKVSQPELAEQTDIKKDNRFIEGNLNLYNSPARGIVLNNKEKPNPEVLAAMYMAIGDLLKTDRSKLLRGYKTNKDIALMFEVQEHEVTKDMRDFAKEHGTLAKTVTNTLGKTTLKHLGLSKKTEGTSKYEYEVLQADLGNIALLLAEQLDLVDYTSVKSNKVATLFKEGEEREADTDTYFVNIKDRNDPASNTARKIPTDKAEKFIDSFKEAAENFPEAQLNRVEAHFTPPTKERLEKAKTKIRNDIIGKKIPKEAQKTLEVLMNTAYKADIERIDAFLAEVDKKNSVVLKQLGYVELDSPEYEILLAEDKEIQVVTNRELETVIDELRKLRERIDAHGEQDPLLYFDYYYMGNDRFGLGSNTINPQVDKLVRFLIVPKDHEMEYTLENHPNGGLLFNAKSSTGESKQSFTARLALTQAFGQGVDKMRVEDVVEYAEALLHMSKKKLKKVKKAMLTTGKYELKHKGKVFELEAEHLTHTLQAIDFLEKVQKAAANGTSFKSSLSLEFDSLTSGFANKVQQLPILDHMDEHLARVGVFTKQFIADLEKTDAFKDGFDIKKGHSVATILAEGENIGFYDSYQNLARLTVKGLFESDVVDLQLSQPVKQKAKSISGKQVYDAIKDMLPGGKYSKPSELRNLFKPPFMTFNYSASINRIIKNLGTEVSTKMLRVIATTDMRKADNAHIKKVAADLLESAVIYKPKTKVRIKTIPELQELLRTYQINEFGVKEFKVNLAGKRAYKATNLANMLEHVITLTYGKVIKDVFEKEFAPFIKVQDAMNDTFKVSFRIFDKKRMDALNKLRQSKKDGILTVEDHAQVLEDLWDDFPWIVGPLTGSDKKGEVKKDIIAVFSTTTKDPNVIEAARRKPQTRLGEHYKKDTRTVSPLVKLIAEAVSAGAVLPFHAIDGAEMSYTLNKLGIEAVNAIHDAIIAPLDQSDRATFTYQEGMFKINREYSLADALQGIVDRIEKTVKKEKFQREFKDVTTKGVKAVGEDKEIKFPDLAKAVVGSMQAQIDIIQAARKEFYGKGGRLEGAYYGNMVGNGMFQEGMTEPDTSYLDFVDSLLTPYEIEQLNVEKEENVTVEDLVLELPFAEGVSKNLLRSLALADSIEDKRQKLVNFRDRKATSVKNKALLTDIISRIDEALIASYSEILEETRDAELGITDAVNLIDKGCE